MDWERDKCLFLIEEYRNYPELWYPRHGLYFNRSRKHECWTLIGKALDSSAEEVKKKMESLLGSFRRERSKGTKTVGVGKAAHEVYVSNWFAFKKMMFLMDKDQPKLPRCLPADDESESDHVDAATDGEHSTGSTSWPADGDHDLDTSTSTPRIATAPSSSFKRMPRVKLKRPRPRPADEKVGMEGSVDILKETVHTNSSLQLQDECGIFGQHVANKLRKYDPRTRAIVQHEISSALFNADMKLFPHPPIPTNLYGNTAHQTVDYDDRPIRVSSPFPPIPNTCNSHPQHNVESKELKFVNKP